MYNKKKIPLRREKYVYSFSTSCNKVTVTTLEMSEVALASRADQDRSDCTLCSLIFDLLCRLLCSKLFALHFGGFFIHSLPNIQLLG